jgi:ribosome recycling factor
MVACMAVMARETWTDERLDDLAKRMDKGFDEGKVEIRHLRAHTDKGFDEVKGEMRELRSHTDKGFDEAKGEVRELRHEMNEGFARVDSKFDALDNRFDAMQRTMIICFAGIAGSIAASVIGGIFVTQL